MALHLWATADENKVQYFWLAQLLHLYVTVLLQDQVFLVLYPTSSHTLMRVIFTDGHGVSRKLKKQKSCSIIRLHSLHLCCFFRVCLIKIHTSLVVAPCLVERISWQTFWRDKASQLMAWSSISYFMIG